MANPRGEYLQQLDGVRALAIGAVLLAHLMPQDFLLCQVAHFSRLGVLLFFTLSGFLITGILLRGRDAAAGSGGTGRVIGMFYVRRLLRIFPIFYLSLLVLALAGNHSVREHLAWYATYTINIGVTFFGASYHHTGHLWSLCVEEQFYLLWPFIVLLAPRKILPAATVAIIVGSIGFKLTGALTHLLTGLALKMTLFGCLDSLGLGALLAIASSQAAPAWLTRRGLARLGLVAGLPALVVVQGSRFLLGTKAFGHPYYTGFSDAAACLAFLPLLAYAAGNGTGPLGRFLSWSPVCYLGKISYGVYLFHVFIKPMCFKALTHIDPTVAPRGLPMLLLTSAASIGLAALSWRLLESPINNLKRYFPYSLPARVEVEPVRRRLAA